MLILLLACLPTDDARLEALEIDNRVLQERVDTIEAHNRELQQQVARIEQSMVAFSGALSVPTEPSSSTEEHRCISDGAGTMQLDPEALDPETLARSVRIVPHRSATGTPDGFRLSGIRRGSILESCGFKNGDIVRSVNGHPLSTVDGAMAAYNTVASQAHFSFTLIRRNQEMTVDFGVSPSPESD